jgi:hypothetical protein
MRIRRRRSGRAQRRTRHLCYCCCSCFSCLSFPKGICFCCCFCFEGAGLQPRRNRHKCFRALAPEVRFAECPLARNYDRRKVKPNERPNIRSLYGSSRLLERVPNCICRNHSHSSPQRPQRQARRSRKGKFIHPRREGRFGLHHRHRRHVHCRPRSIYGVTTVHRVVDNL